VIEGEVIHTVYLGPFLECEVQVGPDEVAVQMNHDGRLVPGQKVYLSLQPEHGLCLGESPRRRATACSPRPGDGCTPEGAPGEPIGPLMRPYDQRAERARRLGGFRGGPGR
jgi:hypothetical protein